MNITPTRPRILNPLERFSEIVFGLIMVLSFTGALSVAEVGREDVRTMWIGAIGCNLAWGIIDAAFYLFACLTEHGRKVTLMGKLKEVTSPEQTRDVISEVLPEAMAAALNAQDYQRIREHLISEPIAGEKFRLTGRDWKGALGVFLLVFLSTFPVVVPFMVTHNHFMAMRISNGVAIVLLFASGRMLANYAGLSPLRTGLSMVAIGGVLVSLTIALGG
jgi:hypothetical protein